jgi:hypothetical protein
VNGYVILTYSDASIGFKIIDILPVGQMREDVSKQYGLKYIMSGWSGNLYLKNQFSNFDKCNIQAYGFDAQKNILYSLKKLCSQ